MGTGSFKFYSMLLWVSCAGGTLAASCVSAPAETFIAPSQTPTPSDPLDPAPTDDLQLSLSSSKVTDASAVIVTAKLDTRYWGENLRAAQIQGKFKGVEFQFYPRSLKRGIFEGVLGIGYLFDPGTYKIQVEARVGKEKRKAEIPLTITVAKYKEETLSVEPGKIAPSATDMKRIEAEKKEVGRVYRAYRTEKLWKGKFQRPMKSKLTSRFGNKRLFNGQMQSYHNGIDFRAKVGRPIHSAAAGIVVMAKDLFFTGGTVIVDHGYGIFTLYAHMSKVTSKLGQKVKIGQVLGKSGATGRVSGPHLHFAVIIQNIKVNPEQFLKVIQ